MPAIMEFGCQWRGSCGRAEGGIKNGLGDMNMREDGECFTLFNTHDNN